MENSNIQVKNNDIKGLRTYKKDAATAQIKKENGAPKKIIEGVKLKMPRDKAPILKQDTPINTIIPPKIPVIKDAILAEEVALAEKIRDTSEVREEKRRNLEITEGIRKEREAKEKETKEKNKALRVIEERKQSEEKQRKIEERKVIERSEIEKKIGELTQKNTEIEQGKEGFVTEKANIAKTLQSINEREASVENAIKEIEKEEASITDISSKKEIEKRRWGMEESRRSIEKERWDVEKKIEAIDATINEKDAILVVNNNEINTLGDRKNELENEEKKKEFEQLLKDVSKIKEKFELEWIKLNDKKEALKTSMTTLLGNESNLDKEKAQLEERESSTTNTEERRGYEQSRWGVEKKRRETEEMRWGKEEEINNTNKEINTLKPKYQEALAREDELQKNLEEVS